MMNEATVFVPFIQCHDIDNSDLLHITRPLEADEYGVFFKLLRQVIDRWHHAVSNMAPHIYAEYHTHRGIIRDVETQFKIMTVDDGEKYMQSQFILSHMLTAVHVILSAYASAFKENEDVCLFYYNIASIIQRTFESLCDGDV